MKRKVAILLVLSLCFTALSACGTNDKPKETGNSQVSQNSEMESSEITTGEVETSETQISEVDSETTKEPVNAETESDVTQTPSETPSPSESQTSSETQVPSEVPTPSESQTPSVTPEPTPEEPSEADSYYEAGRACLYGLNGTEFNLEKALASFTKAKELGKVEANFYLGVLCDWYSYPTQDFAKAKEYYEAAGENPYAQIALGYLYDNGQGVEKDSDKAQSYWQKALDAGCVDAKYANMGEAYKAKDYETARQLCLEIVESGTEPLYTSRAWNQLGTIYRLGRGVDVDYVKSIEYYNKAIELGCPSSMLNLATLYINGQGTEKDYEKGLALLKQGKALGEDVHENYIENLEECIAVAKTLENPVFLNLELHFYNENGDLEFSADEVCFRFTENGEWLHMVGFTDNIIYNRYVTMNASGESHLEIKLVNGDTEKILTIPDFNYDNEKKPSSVKVSITYYGIPEVEWN